MTKSGNKRALHLVHALTALAVAGAGGQAVANEAAAPAAPGMATATGAPVLALPVLRTSGRSNGVSYGEAACTPSEHWSFGPSVSKGFIRGFETSAARKMKPVAGFSEALALRRFAQTNEARIFGEYWISRALLDAGMVHVAFEGFAMISSRPIADDTAGIQLASVACLARIQEKHPSMTVPAGVTAQLSGYARVAARLPEGANAKETIWEAVSLHLRQQLSEEKAAARDAARELEPTLALLKGGGAYEAFGRGLVAARKGDHAETAAQLDKFVSGAAGSIPSGMKRYLDPAHLLLSRAYFSRGQFEKSELQLKMVSKASNQLSNSLSEMAWAYLQHEKLPEAIGTAINLERGGLRKTYAPEAPMVMAMALNELCQYPESIRSINMFRKNYEEPYRWLVSWAGSASPEKLYPQAVNYIRRKKGVPEKVASEWVRSPIFISTQDEINLLFDERDSSVTVGKTGASEERRITADLIKFVREFKERLKLAKARNKPGAELSKDILADLHQIREGLTHLKRIQMAGPVWKKVLVTHQKNVPVVEKKLVARINRELDAKSVRMMQQMEEIAENIQLIEVEIYNGASQDIIWQNAHPDYKKMAEQLTEERKTESAAKTWDWGRTPASALGEEEEIWEDELGSFKAQLFDNCTSKDKFLAIKKINRR